MVLPRVDQTQSLSSRVQDTYKNDQIRADVIIVIDEEGVNVGEFTRDKALEYARTLGLDLVQIRYQRVGEKRVATAKVIDYGKFLFDQKKKDKQKKLSQKSSNKGIKEIKLGYSTTMNDVLVKVAKLKELILDGYSIKLVMRLKGRERNFKTLAIEKMSHIMDLLSDIAKPQFPEVKIDKYGMYQILIHR